MASDYCDSVEVTTALKRHEAGKCLVIPIILRPVSWKIARFSKLQALPSGAKPISTWFNKDQAYFDIEEGLIKVIEEISNNSIQEVTKVLPTHPQIHLSNLNTALLSPSAKPVEAEPSKFYIDQTSIFSDQYNSMVLSQTVSELEQMQPTTNTTQLLTTQYVKDRWEHIKRRIRTQKDGAKVAALLNDCNVMDIEDDKLPPIIVVKASTIFHYPSLQRNDYQKIIEQAFNIELGQEYQLRILPP